MQDDVQPMQPRPQGPQNASTGTVFPSNQNNQSGQNDQFMGQPSTPVVPEKKKSNGKWIVIIILTLIVGLLAGYLIGGKMKESDASAKYEAQISSLQSELDEANATIKTGTKEGTKTMTQLQEENADLKATNAALTKQVEDLQKQLEEAKKDDTTTPATP